jgi:UDPglucose--hexose-1-phosphate uridylyltransferase
LKLHEDSHRRLNPLTNEWVLVSPHRAQRPWQGSVEKVPVPPQAQYDPACYLCPGNKRAGGQQNPAYANIFVFENDFAALKPDTATDRLDLEAAGLLVAEGEPGVCRVMCFSPRHDLTLSTMSVEQIEKVVRGWKEQFCELGGMPGIRHVQIFENRGEMMGASNPHPHCQIWATSSIPNAPSKEFVCQREYHRTRNGCLLCDYIRLEDEQALRIVFADSDFVVLVPFWAIWPFETLICSRRHIPTFLDFNDQELTALSNVLKRITAGYDRVFDVPFPYSMGFHQSPTNESEHPEWHFHAHFYPPLLRSAMVRKFMVGFELLGTPQRDITPEMAAERLQVLCREPN